MAVYLSMAVKSGRRRKILISVAVLALLFGLDYWLYPQFARPADVVANRRENGLWLRYTWYFGKHDRAEIKALADRLNRHGIRDAFFHVRSADNSGRLVHRYPDSAKALNTQLSLAAPSVRKIAWIYIDSGAVHLRSEDVRKNLVQEATWLVGKCGFDGVQWDYEPCPNGDRTFTALLDETRTALHRAYIGVATPGWYPTPLSSEGWSPSYFREVAKRCDDLAVMAYDSGMVTPRAYVWWVGHQVVEVTRAAEGTGCKVLIGVPTYGRGGPSHNAYAENLRLGIIGVRDGLANDPAMSAWQGVAVFADYTTTSGDWDEFDRLWPAPVK